jgi:hypothetical protein
MSELQPFRCGDTVRLYINEENFDEGVVIETNATNIVVDFYDWLELWPIDEPMRNEACFSSGCWYWVPNGRGIINKTFSLDEGFLDPLLMKRPDRID